MSDVATKVHSSSEKSAIGFGNIDVANVLQRSHIQRG